MIIPERRQRHRAGCGEPVTPTARPTAGGHVYTAAQIEAVLGVRPGTLRQWAARGQVRKVGRDLYDGDSVIARWRQSEAAAGTFTSCGSP